MAGVPRIMQAMFDSLAPTLEGGAPIISRAVYAMGLLEGAIAEDLAAVQKRYPELDVGSYPFARDAGSGVAIVSKGTDVAAAEAATAEVTLLMEKLGLNPVQGEPAI
jgi:molybdopterin-biosynthesis enzyme MoeA-like protein